MVGVVVVGWEHKLCVRLLLLFGRCLVSPSQSVASECTQDLCCDKLCVCVFGALSSVYVKSSSDDRWPYLVMELVLGRHRSGVCFFVVCVVWRTVSKSDQELKLLRNNTKATGGRQTKKFVTTCSIRE